MNSAIYKNIWLIYKLGQYITKSIDKTNVKELLMTLQSGDTAPDFTLPTDGNGVFSLSQQRGKMVVLYFYPKDDTTGCTAQACDFRDSMMRLQGAGAKVIGVSKDSIESHDKFKSKHQLNFPLASDENGLVCERYGVWAEKSMYGKTYMGIERTTFLIDEEGQIAHIWRKVSVQGHVQEVFDAMSGKLPAANSNTPAVAKKPAKAAKKKAKAVKKTKTAKKTKVAKKSKAPAKKKMKKSAPKSKRKTKVTARKKPARKMKAQKQKKTSARKKKRAA
jgi:peroxiredoxin Q/BCP